MAQIKAQCIYSDLKSRPATRQKERKARLAGKTLSKFKVIGFFELTSRKYVADFLRLNIRRSDLERMDPQRLQHPDGCIKLQPEFLSFDEVLAKKNHPDNGFPNIGRLRDDKWKEFLQMCQDPQLHTSSDGIGINGHKLLIHLTHDEPDVAPALKQLGLA